jgi:trehalose/maltose transport system substrate-binding protein
MPPSSTDQFGQYKLSPRRTPTSTSIAPTSSGRRSSPASFDLTEATKDVVGDHFPAIIESQTVNGKLVALPVFTDAPALYYRKDLLEKYGASVPKTWSEMAETAKLIMDKEREAGATDIWGFVFQGNASRGSPATRSSG